MPGLKLSFSCPCGYRKGDVTAGATERGHYQVVLCDTCHRIFSLWRDLDQDDPAKSRHCPECGQTVPIGRPLVCRECGNPTTDVTAPGAWGPPDLQKRFPDTEPWMIDTGDLDPDIPEERIARLESIRIRCPRCRELSLRWSEDAIWD